MRGMDNSVPIKVARWGRLASSPFIWVLFLLIVSACGRSNPHTPPPIAPLHLRGMNVVELDSKYPPFDLFGHSYVSTGTTGEIYLVDIETGEKRKLTSDGRLKYYPVLSGDHVAWIEYHKPSKLPGRASSNDILVLDLETGEQRRLTTEPAEREGLRIHGHRLVWSENRHQETGSDIYAYDLESNEEIPVAVWPGAQQEPAIHENTVVWADNRNSPHVGTIKAGCGNCAENTFDIYLYDFDTGEERPIVQTGALNTGPAVYGSRVAWLRYQTDPDSSSVYLLDLETGLEREIGNTGRHGGWPLVSDRYVAWSVRRDCDVRLGNDPKITGLYISDLQEHETTQLSNYVEPNALIHENVIVITEGCDSIGRVYAVFLEE